MSAPLLSVEHFPNGELHDLYRCNCGCGEVPTYRVTLGGLFRLYCERCLTLKLLDVVGATTVTYKDVAQGA